LFYLGRETDRDRSMFSEKELQEISRRSDFYKEKEVAKFLLTRGVPKNKASMLKLVELDDSSSDSKESLNCLKGVAFVVHPQQINIRDKSNGKMIISIPR
jgi:hypothetical protein